MLERKPNLPQREIIDLSEDGFPAHRIDLQKRYRRFSKRMIEKHGKSESATHKTAAIPLPENYSPLLFDGMVRAGLIDDIVGDYSPINFVTGQIHVREEGLYGDILPKLGIVFELSRENGHIASQDHTELWIDTNSLEIKRNKITFENGLIKFFEFGKNIQTSNRTKHKLLLNIELCTLR